MATMKELRDERLRKLSELRALGVNAYPAEAARTPVSYTHLDVYKRQAVC